MFFLIIIFRIKQLKKQSRLAIKYLRFRVDAPEDEDVIRRQISGEPFIASSNPSSKYTNLQISSATSSAYFQMNKKETAAQYKFCPLE